MTTYIPSLTLPSLVFDNMAVSILLPVLAGAGIGYSTRRTFSHIYIDSLRSPGVRLCLVRHMHRETGSDHLQFFCALQRRVHMR